MGVHTSQETMIFEPLVGTQKARLKPHSGLKKGSYLGFKNWSHPGIKKEPHLGFKNGTHSGFKKGSHTVFKNKFSLGNFLRNP